MRLGLMERPTTREAFEAVQRRLDPLTVLVAISYVKSRKAAERIYWAERHGRGRPAILASASQRMDDFDHPLATRADVVGSPISRENFT